MPNLPSLLNQQSQEIKDKIVEMAQTKPYNDIVEWLNDRGIAVSYTQVQYFIQTHSIPTRLSTIAPVKGHAAKVQAYIGALLAYEADTFTIGNIRLHGASWSQVSQKLRKDGLIEPMRDYSPRRWRIIATKDKLREWMKNEVKE